MLTQWLTYNWHGITWMFLHSWHWSRSWIRSHFLQAEHLFTFDWKTDLSITHSSHPINLSSSHHPITTPPPPEDRRGLYNRTRTTNRKLAVDTCRLSVNRKCIYLGNEGETFNFLKPISCQHWWLNISWARVWSGSGELPVRRFSRHSDWWGDISRAAVPYAVTRSYPPLYTVGQLSVVPAWHGRYQQKKSKMRSSAKDASCGFAPTQRKKLFLTVFELVLAL